MQNNIDLREINRLLREVLRLKEENIRLQQTIDEYEDDEKWRYKYNIHDCATWREGGGVNAYYVFLTYIWKILRNLNMLMDWLKWP